MDTVVSIWSAFHQFYLLDDDELPPYPERITDADLRAGAKAAPNIVAVYTTSDETVTIRVAREAEIDAAAWSHIVDAPLLVPSGRVLVAAPESDLAECQRVVVPSGSYRLRIAARPLGTAEEYLVSMWPGTITGVSVLKSDGRYAA